MANYLSIYITASSRDEAENIGHHLVKEKLAACVNILPGMQSIYRWEGRIETADETVLIAKTRSELFERLEKRTKELHSYECPCIVAWPITAGHRPYLDWIEKETEA
jgi:periplasmic divalent cation tolerance protein